MSFRELQEAREDNPDMAEALDEMLDRYFPVSKQRKRKQREEDELARTLWDKDPDDEGQESEPEPERKSPSMKNKLEQYLTSFDATKVDRGIVEMEQERVAKARKAYVAGNYERAKKIASKKGSMTRWRPSL